METNLSLTLPTSFEFSVTSCQKIKVWYMRGNGILFPQVSQAHYESPEQHYPT